MALTVGSAAAIWAAVTHRLADGPAPSSGTVIPSAREYVTASGERAVLTLVDGTRVILGAASRLTVSPKYGSGTDPRLVTLEGEGYFEAVHDAAHPFTVQVGHRLVRDVGTKFVVRAFAPDHSVAVAVTEGEVMLAGTRLRQGDLGRLDATGAVRVRSGADLRSYTSWITGRLVFDDTPLAEAIPVLERWYDLDITVADSALYRRRLFATLESQPVTNVLDLIALSLNLRVERRGRIVTFSQQRP